MQEYDRGLRSVESQDRRFRIRLAKKIMEIYNRLGNPVDLRPLAEQAAVLLLSEGSGDWFRYL